MKHKINNRFTLCMDKYNWILVDNKTSRVKKHYFPNLKLLTKFIGELKAKESLGEGGVDLGDIASVAPSYDAVLNRIAKSLENYIKKITEK